MDFMLILEIIVLLGAIFIGVKLGGIGIGYAGGLGVIVLTIGLGLKMGSIPWDVILIIASVISAIGAMQVAGGLDYLTFCSTINCSCFFTNSNYSKPCISSCYIYGWRYGTWRTWC